ncbi:MAG: neutral/alkaline non-lysosomal ceramidase N-terminal domain-containing protein [Thermoguttaceae bacterium]
MNVARITRRILLALALIAPVSLKADAAAPPATAPVGVAKVDITPDTPVRMYGYASRTKESEGVAGRLTATALVIGASEEPGPAVLLSVDCGSVPSQLRDEVYKRVCDKTPVAPERFVLCNTHCHSGPNLKGMGSLEGAEKEHMERYAEQLADRLVQIVEQALDRRQPARLEIARGTVPFAANRRVLKDGKWSGFGAVPDAPADHELVVMKVTGDDGKVLAVVSNYACHNTTLRGDFMQIHGDWAGSARTFIEADQPGATALITIGCGADSDPCPHSTAALCDQHGRQLADEVHRLLTGSSWTSITPQVVARQKILSIPWQKDVDIDIARKTAKNSWAVAAALEAIDKGTKMPDEAAYQINTWTFGDDLAMVFLSNEVVVDYVLQLKKDYDPARLWVSAYANDVSTYITSPRVIAEGGYEARNCLSSLVTLGQPEKLNTPLMDRILAAVREMLPTTFRKQP